jgi:putative acetyltransferase
MNELKYLIKIDDLQGPEIIALLAEHLRSLAEVSPPGTMHALDLKKLRQPDITFWSVWNGPDRCGCGALKELSREHGEIKSMRTASPYLRRGVATHVLDRIITEAVRRGYRRLSLETGAGHFFAPAHRLYRRFGFAPCGPFEGYSADPNSLFMTKML